MSSRNAIECESIMELNECKWVSATLQVFKTTVKTKEPNCANCLECTDGSAWFDVNSVGCTITNRRKKKRRSCCLNYCIMQIFVGSTHKPVTAVVLTFRIMNQLQGIFAFIIMATGCGAGLKYVYLWDTNVALRVPMHCSSFPKPKMHSKCSFVVAT